jgi:hypothetical protein
MGFSGGGSNILKSHTHDGSISQDGGALNMDGVTQGSLTAGDVIYSDGSNLQRLAIGAASDTLQVNGAATAPEWVAASGGFTMTTQFTSYTANQTTTSGSLVDIPGSTWTLANRAGGKAYMTAFHTLEGNGAAYVIGAGLNYDGADAAISKQTTHSSGAAVNICVSGITDTDGGAVVGRFRISGGTCTIKNGSGENSGCNALELS